LAQNRNRWRKSAVGGRNHHPQSSSIPMTDKMPEWRELASHGTATVHEAIGGVGAIAPAIRPLDPGMRLIGAARTVLAPPGDNLMLHIALARPLAGCVLVVDAGGYLEAGPWGEVMTTAAMAAGCLGLVIDGAVRDAERIIALGFPVFARGLCIRGTTKTAAGQVGAPVSIGGITVSDGDLIIGDQDGLVAVPRNLLPDALEMARRRTQKEHDLMARLRDGATTLDLLNLRQTARSLGLIGR
jgi:4-hydroxy-4-methyl-2-oxoglutarate aldolase